MIWGDGMLDHRSRVDRHLQIITGTVICQRRQAGPARAVTSHSCLQVMDKAGNRTPDTQSCFLYSTNGLLFSEMCFILKNEASWALVAHAVILATWEVEIKRIAV
jgi:hypothetical protein